MLEGYRKEVIKKEFIGKQAELSWGPHLGWIHSLCNPLWESPLSYTGQQLEPEKQINAFLTWQFTVISPATHTLLSIIRRFASENF